MAKRRAKTSTAHAWQFRARFRRHAFGWRSQPAIRRIKEAVTEIKRVARKDPLLGAEGAVLLLERLSPAIEDVDSSSGSIGTAVNNAIVVLAGVIAAAPAGTGTREAWLERLWEAYEADCIPYLESLGHHWGELCVSPEIASRWVDRLIDGCRHAFSPDPKLRAYFKGTTNCLSAMVVAGRHQELLDLLQHDRLRMWDDRQYGVRALAALGRIDDALRYAASGSPSESPWVGARLCQEILLAAGRTEEAYQRYGVTGNASTTYLSTFRAILKTYPHKTPAQVLADLVQRSPGGSWFAAAKEAELFDEAIALAWRTPTAHGTLTRAARDFVKTRPDFAMEAGLAAIHWIARGHGYEVTGGDVLAAYTATVEAAENAGRVDDANRRMREIVAGEGDPSRFVRLVLASKLD